MEIIEKYLPPNVRNAIRNTCENQWMDFNDLTEIRLRINCPLIIFIKNNEYVISEYIVNEEDIKTAFNLITEYSAYSFESSIRNGYITIPGGHRVGLGGQVVMDDKGINIIKNIKFMNYRISHDLKNAGCELVNKIVEEKENLLIISPPGLGKTTLLRNIIRGYSNLKGINVTVVDERNEIGGSYRGVPMINLGLRTDIISDCTKYSGIVMAIRSMAPKVIAVDEIGSGADFKAIEYAVNSGVSVVATIHGKDLAEAREKLGQDIDKIFKRKIVIKSMGEYVCI